MFLSPIGDQQQGRCRIRSAVAAEVGRISSGHICVRQIQTASLSFLTVVGEFVLCGTG